MRAAAAPSPSATPSADVPPVEPPTTLVDLDYSPSVAVPVPTDESSDPTDPEGSFYSRRSAKLPHIGKNAGEDSFSAIRSMRAGLE